MKNIPLIALVVIAFVGCAKQEAAPAPKEEATPEVTRIVRNSPDTYTVSRTCIDGVFYLMYSKTIIVQRDRNDTPVQCGAPLGN